MTYDSMLLGWRYAASVIAAGQLARSNDTFSEQGGPHAKSKLQQL
jgi:hypothetical protein